MKQMTFWLAVALATATAGSAQDFQPRMQQYINDHVMDWANDPIIVDAIIAQNATTASYDQARIGELDALWMAQMGMSGVPLIDEVLQNPASDFLRDRMAAAGGAISEVFVMDARGLNVAAAKATSDYWQGDEAKFSETYPKGPTAIHFGDVELDPSSGEVQAQVSLSIVDSTGAVVGAMTVGINLTSLM
ncbi:cache domain-containing protein [Yoonia vestfoldensis]|uniref:cache domain-containing protein n=1 Tax=Yoonia vestfoldensis TaxID=245188 RepID=UPI00036942CC|nr:cache domain-containing protein [Yoonia vestfoldensis]